MGDTHVGLQARLMSQALRKLAGAVKKSNTCLIFTNQIRIKIGVLFGNPETTAGGRALRFYSSVRMEIRSRGGRSGAIMEGKEQVGRRSKVKIKKNKVAPPFREAEFDIMYDEGVSVTGDVLDVGTELDIIDKRGAYYSYDGIRLGQGRENAKGFLAKNPALLASIDHAIRDQAGLPTKAQSVNDPAATGPA